MPQTPEHTEPILFKFETTELRGGHFAFGRPGDLHEVGEATDGAHVEKVEVMPRQLRHGVGRCKGTATPKRVVQLVTRRQLAVIAAGQGQQAR